MEKGGIIKHDQKKAPKTGDWRFMQPVVDKEKCIGCQTCVPVCPEASIVMEKYAEFPKEKAEIDLEYCKGCGVCAAVCPVKAITMKKQ